ncbi:hypothetical protein ACFL6U_08850 [Planctomycetota bacterium]
MNIYEILKALGAVLLFYSITLPMYRRYQEPGHTQTEQASSQNQQVIYEPDSISTGYHFIIGQFHPLSFNFWLEYFIFSWPLLTIGLLHWRAIGLTANVARGFEPVLLVGSAWALGTYLTWSPGDPYLPVTDRPPIGPYVAFASLGIYAIGVIGNDALVYGKWKSRKCTQRDRESPRGNLLPHHPTCDSASGDSVD